MSKKKKDDNILRDEARVCMELMLKEYRRRLTDHPGRVRAADMQVIRSIAKDLGVQPAADHPDAAGLTAVLAELGELPFDVSIPEEFRKDADKQPKH